MFSGEPSFYTQDELINSSFLIAQVLTNSEKWLDVGQGVYRFCYCKKKIYAVSVLIVLMAHLTTLGTDGEMVY